MDFDPAVISYEDLLDLFWKAHDPFRASYCNQYAARIFYHDGRQREAASSVIERLEEEKGRKVLTKLDPYTRFYMAEDYHQKYYLKSHGRLLAELRAVYPEEKDFVSSTAVARVNGYLGGNGSLEQLKRELPLLGLSEEGQEQLLRAFRQAGPVS